MDYITTSALANKLDISSTALFEHLKKIDWIKRHDGKWILTELGIKHGGTTRTNPEYGEVIIWPENVVVYKEQP